MFVLDNGINAVKLIVKEIDHLTADHNVKFFDVVMNDFGDVFNFCAQHLSDCF